MHCDGTSSRRKKEKHDETLRKEEKKKDTMTTIHEAKKLTHVMTRFPPVHHEAFLNCRRVLEEYVKQGRVHAKLKTSTRV